MALPKPVMVEVLVYAPTMFFHCQHCEFVWQKTGAAPDYRKEQLESAIPEDLMQQYQELSDWVLSTAQAYGGRVIFKVIDAASIEGLYKSLRYRTRKYPGMPAGSQSWLTRNGLNGARRITEEGVAATC